ncbi:MAG: KH domain-containing protein [Verrucomicrobiota bacterium JB023]|nr:KH domain-containing protein [Verrucomicrobiota bacterium JB023]
MQQATSQIRDFLQYVALQFIEHPEQAQLRVGQPEENHISLRLILAHEDVAQLIGRGGFTASAIRNVVNSVAARENIKVTLRIHSVEEEQQRLAEIEAKEIIED